MAAVGLGNDISFNLLDRRWARFCLFAAATAILAMIPHHLIAPTNLTIPNLSIQRPQHPHRQMRMGVINVINYTGVTVVMPLERLIGTVTSGAVQSGGVIETLWIPQIQMGMTI